MVFIRKRTTETEQVKPAEAVAVTVVQSRTAAVLREVEAECEKLNGLRSRLQSIEAEGATLGKQRSELAVALANGDSTAHEAIDAIEAKLRPLQREREGVLALIATQERTVADKQREYREVTEAEKNAAEQVKLKAALSKARLDFAELQQAFEKASCSLGNLQRDCATLHEGGWSREAFAILEQLRTLSPGVLQACGWRVSGVEYGRNVLLTIQGLIPPSM